MCKHGWVHTCTTCVQVSVRARASTCMSLVCTHVCVCTTCVQVSVRARASTCVSLVCTRVCVCTMCVQVSVCARASTCVSLVCTHVCVCTTCVQVSVRARASTCMSLVRTHVCVCSGGPSSMFVCVCAPMCAGAAHVFLYEFIALLGRHNRNGCLWGGRGGQTTPVENPSLHPGLPPRQSCRLVS